MRCVVTAEAHVDRARPPDQRGLREDVIHRCHRVLQPSRRETHLDHDQISFRRDALIREGRCAAITIGAIPGSSPGYVRAMAAAAVVAERNRQVLAVGMARERVVDLAIVEVDADLLSRHGDAAQRRSDIVGLVERQVVAGQCRAVAVHRVTRCVVGESLVPVEQDSCVAVVLAQRAVKDIKSGIDDAADGTRGPSRCLPGSAAERPTRRAHGYQARYGRASAPRGAADR